MTAKKLTVLQGGGERPVDACADCRHLIRESTGPSFWKCGAFAGRYTSQLRPDVAARCIGFSRVPPLAPRPPGLLRRFWRWLW
ncbi:MAG TPA: hypothetical protein VHG09_02875 [Longimicrobiales bacterium]|nr:hypothetical protein [Longimicrobiales bacterium]